MGGVSRIRMRVLLDDVDGTTWEVDTDQRDQARYELQEFYAPGRPLTAQRFMAYVASARKGLTSLSWPKFDAACLEVVGVEAGQTEVGPTKPDPSGAP